jgi:LysM repeat protein
LYIIGIKHVIALKVTTIALSICCYSFSFAQSSSDIRDYIHQYKSIALEQERLYGIPAPITLAQGILESGAGKSGLATNANNHFGIKAVGGWSGGIYLAWDDEAQKSRFRVYSSAAASYEDHSKVLKEGSRYQSLFNYSIYDYRSWAYGLQKAGYASASEYAKALIGYIDAYQLYTINGGVKLKPGKKTVISKTITVEELSLSDDLVIDESVATEEEEDVQKITNKYAVLINGVRCTILYPGETLSSIAMKYDIPRREILKLNETDTESDISEGDVVYLQKKKRKYYGALDFYRAKEGETIYEISQQFGIKKDRLAKMNHMTPSTVLAEGELVRLK